MRTVVLGGGSWGTALGNLMANQGFKTTIWLRDENTAQSINRQHVNSRYLPGLALCDSLKATTNAEEAFDEAELCIMAIPSQSARSTLKDMSGLFAPGLPLICVSKGIELSSLKPMSAMVAEELPKVRYAIMSGPSFAMEVVQGMPTAVSVACAEKTLGEQLREVFSCHTFRAYSCRDVIGVEMGGALKNVIAIAAGVSDGLGFGHNARAALITRGLAEISRLGEAMGATPATFMGLSGMGDLVLTCTGDLSRNRQVGLKLAEGKALNKIISEMSMVAEGVKTTEAAVALGERLGVDLPVARSVQSLLSGEISAGEAVRLLMTRDLKEEYPAGE